jgi:hypothetical protein
MRRLASIAVVVATALAGCQAIPQRIFRSTATEQALVNWRTDNDSLTADVVFQKGAEESVRLTVTKGVRLLVLTGERGRWTATGPFARGGWAGSANAAPGALAGWVALAEAYLAADRVPGGETELRTGRYAVRYTRDAVRLTALDLVSHDHGDAFQARFGP